MTATAQTAPALDHPTFPFTLTEDQEALRREIRDFAAREIAPNVLRWDEASEFPHDVVRQLGQMGLLGVIFPPNTAAPASATPTTCSPSKNSPPSMAPSESSSPRIIRSARITSSSPALKLKRRSTSRNSPPANTSARGDSPSPAPAPTPRAARTTAVRRGDQWVLNGNKTFITNGHYADVSVIIAVTNKEEGTHGLSAFIVEKGTPGFRPGKKENKLGLRASDTSELIFEDCAIPAENLLGKEGEGFVDAMRTLDGGRISIAALSLGIGRGALDASVHYVKQRKQFGKAIAEFQGIQWKLADMATELDAARLLTLRAAVLKDAGKRVTQESAMAKLYASPKSPSKSATKPSSSTAATASSRITPSRSSTATSNSAPSAKAPAKSSAWSSAAKS